MIRICDNFNDNKLKLTFIWKKWYNFWGRFQLVLIKSMGTVVSFFSFSKLYRSLIDFNQSIDGNWFLYFNFLVKFFIKKLKSKPRFDLYDIEVDGDPYAIGLLPPKQEWTYECPQKVSESQN